MYSDEVMYMYIMQGVFNVFNVFKKLEKGR